MIRNLLVAGMAAVATITFAPLAHADSGDQSAAEQAVTAIYNQVIPGCTQHGNSPNIQSIQWSRFAADSGGEGRIVDANPNLGGPFVVAWWNPRVGPAQDTSTARAYGQWSVKLEFC